MEFVYTCSREQNAPREQNVFWQQSGFAPVYDYELDVKSKLPREQFSDHAVLALNFDELEKFLISASHDLKKL